MTLRLGLQLLDRQLMTGDEDLCGKVDDIELDRENGSIRPAAILMGTAVWPDRLPGPLRALAHRLLRGEVARIDWNEIDETSATIRLRLSAEELGHKRTAVSQLAGRPRLGMLMGARVVGADGRGRGRVREVEAGGPSRGVEGPRVTALLVGRSGLLRRLGLPAPSGKSGRIPWSEVAEWSERVVKLRS